MSIRILIFLLLPVAAIGRQPIGWKAQANRLNDSIYSIEISGTVAPGWHIYASTDEGLGLEPPSLSWGNENIFRIDVLQCSLATLRIKDPVFEGKPLMIFAGDSIHFLQRVIIRDNIPASLVLTIKCFASNDKEFLPVIEILNLDLEGGMVIAAGIRLAAVDLSNPVADCGQQSPGNKKLFSIFLLGILGGLMALFTPCVFPMIPVTVSFFTGNTPDRRRGMYNGLFYGLSIFFIYLLASLPFHFAGNINPGIFNIISTSVPVNILFFIIFIFFALGLFGLFDISLPAGFANSAGSKGGIFFMALTLSMVSFSCTGPILGSLLVTSLSTGGGAFQLTAALAGFGLALALPFGLFAMFPGWLKRLPRSGNWMDTVKKVLAFVELALAFKFLSNADLVMHWGLLKREVFIGIWIFIAIMLSLYLFGVFDPPKPQFYISPAVKKNRHFPRRAAAGMVMLGAIYLLPGLTNSGYASLGLLSGFPPPLSYSIYGKNGDPDNETPVTVINDYQKALKLSRDQHKPLLIEFTGWTCVNCRKMEELVWSRNEINKLIRDNYILVSLYVDDRARLAPDQQFIFTSNDGNSKEIRTQGDKWSTFESENFSYVSQPLYVILSPEEKLLTNPVGYTPDEQEYGRWLQCGLNAFKLAEKLTIFSLENVTPVCVTAK